jgi:hypothetical protein
MLRLQLQADGAGAVSASRGLAVAGQVLFVVGGPARGCSLVYRPTESLAMSATTRRSPSRLHRREQRTPGALLSSENLQWVECSAVNKQGR